MKKRYLIGLVAVCLAVIAVVYVARNGGTPENELPPAAAERHGHGITKLQEAEKPQTQEPSNEGPTVEIPVDKQAMLGVQTVEVSVKPLQKVIRTVGRIDYDERKIATVNAKFEGWIEKLHVDYTGRYVKKGEPLAEVYSPELVATQQELINAVAWARRDNNGKSAEMMDMLSRDARSLVEAARRRLALWDISDEQIKMIEESGKPVRNLTLYSPVGGHVIQKMALRGMRVMPGEKLFDIADLSSVWILADIYENELSLVKPGLSAKISLSYIPGREMTAVIEYVYPALSAESRTAKVRFSVANPGALLKPQMFTNVEITVPVGRKLAVPSDAVLDTGMRQIVYVDKGEGYFEPRQISTGLKVDGMTEVIAGLKAGEKVASSAIFLIDSEAQLKGVRPLPGEHKH